MKVHFLLVGLGALQSLALAEEEAHPVRPQLLPALGMGTAGLFEQTSEVVCEGLRLGFRLFDTAQAIEWYREEGLGQALRLCGADADVVVVTKVHPRSFERSAMRLAVRRSRELIFPHLPDRGLDAVLLHAPFCWPRHCSAEEERRTWREGWRHLEELREEGLVRHIGVSNFDAPLLRELLQLSNRRVSLVQNWYPPASPAVPEALGWTPSTRTARCGGWPRSAASRTWPTAPSAASGPAEAATRS